MVRDSIGWLAVVLAGSAIVAQGQTSGRAPLGSTAESAESHRNPESRVFDTPSPIWEHGVGDGFRAGAFEAGLSLGPGIGMAILNSEQAHDLALASAQFGWMMTGPRGQHWYRGNWELMGELFAGAQYRPDTDYVVGLGPAVRYNFATRSRWVPFMNVGGGFAATSIRGSDLSTTFEYQLQAGVGTRYFLRPNLALTLEYRFLHISNAGIDAPNLGVNTSVIYAGFNYFF
jgi:opacity protein-like surface antigen